MENKTDRKNFGVSISLNRENSRQSIRLGFFEATAGSVLTGGAVRQIVQSIEGRMDWDLWLGVLGLVGIAMIVAGLKSIQRGQKVRNNLEFLDTDDGRPVLVKKP